VVFYLFWLWYFTCSDCGIFFLFHFTS
jgi:hypothetical protein